LVNKKEILIFVETIKVMDMLATLENKLTSTWVKRNDLKNFSYIGQKYDIVERIEKLITKSIIRKERSNIKQYIQNNYGEDITKDELVFNTLNRFFNLQNEFVICEGIKMVEHSIHLSDFLKELRTECELVFKEIENNTLKLF
jgi:hypothetical protein